MRNHHEPAPDFTNAFLTTLGGILFMGLWVVTSLMGMIAALAIATVVDRGFKLIGSRRA